MHIEWDSDKELKTTKNRLISKTIINESGCWLFKGSSGNKYGHRQMSFRSHPAGVHQLSYIVFIGPTNGLCVCHTCDVPNCINPDHLFLGTKKDNCLDMWKKGRGSNPPIHSGMNNHNATLSDSQVVEIKSRQGTLRYLAEEYKVSHRTIWNIQKGITRSEHGNVQTDSATVQQ